MKKIFVLMAVFCLCFQANSVFAATPDFSGYWELDASKSTLPAAMPVESIVLKVLQSEKDLKIENTTRPRKNDSDGARLNVVLVAQTAIYNLEGNETNSEIGNGRTAGKEIRKATITSDNKLNLNLIRSFQSEKGEVTIKINEIWELLDEGKTLKIIRYTETPRGATTAELFFTKKSDGIKTATGTVEVPVMTGSETSPQQISGGVLNGKAISLAKPEYPPAARAVRASGAVNVKVTIDEQGNIISASAVSGHPLLRAAAEEAARNSKFAPTLLQGVPVRITGVIVYNFVP